MKFFIDTANLEEIKKANDMGVLDGVTTNPSLIAKENCDLKSRIHDICKLVNGPVSAEVLSTNFAEMIKEAEELVKISEHVVVKVPLIEEGIKVVKYLSSKKIRTNVTLCFSVGQALLAAKAGATYISPFIGRLDDIQINGMDLIEQIRTVYDNYGYETEILAASIRSVNHVVDAALLGADVATIPFSVISSLIKHPLTESGLEKFLKDANATGC
jgi:transaldolase